MTLKELLENSVYDSILRIEHPELDDPDDENFCPDDTSTIELLNFDNKFDVLICDNLARASWENNYIIVNCKNGRTLWDTFNYMNRVLYKLLKVDLRTMKCHTYGTEEDSVLYEIECLWGTIKDNSVFVEMHDF